MATNKGKKNVWDYNFAQDADIRERVEQFFIPKVKETRQKRIQMESDWMRFFNMWNVTKDGFHSYNGRANLYVPEVRKNIEAQAREMTVNAFPNEDFFNVSAGDSGTPQGAEIQKSVRRWQIRNSRLPVKYFISQRQKCLYGTSPSYVCWRKDQAHVLRSAKKGNKIVPSKKLIDIFNGPDYLPRDLFRWYAFNPKKMDLEDEGCFENIVVNQFDLIAKEKKGNLWDRKTIQAGNSDAYLKEEMTTDILRAETVGIQIDNRGYSATASIRDENSDEQRPASRTHLCTVIFTKMNLPEACEPDEDADSPIPVWIEIYDNEHIGLIKRNPFWHQRVPYTVGRYILPNPDEFYGQGIAWATQYMQYELNSKHEQAMDAGTLALNPIAIVDPGLAAQSNEFPIEPGAIWWGRPDAIKFNAMPDVSHVGHEASQILRAQIMDYSDRNPALPSQLMGKSRTATQSQIVDNEVSKDDSVFEMIAEYEELEPLMEMWESLTDQNIEGDQIIMLLGTEGEDAKRQLVSKNQTLGQYRYFWKGAGSAKNRQITANQMINMMKTIGSLQPEVQAQIKLNWVNLIKYLWTEGFNLPEANKILGFMGGQMKSQDPEAENKMAELGMELQVSPQDDDQQHIQSHQQAIQHPKTPEDQKKDLAIHMLGHIKQARQKQMAQQQQQMAMMHQQQMAAMAGAQGGGGKPASAGGLQGPGNRTQLSPNLTPGSMGSGVRA